MQLIPFIDLFKSALHVSGDKLAHLQEHFRLYIQLWCGPGSSVGIATDYGLDVPGSNPGGDEIFPPVQTGSGAHPASCNMGTGSFPGGKVWPGRAADHSPPF